jgi:hypothetical protein
MAVKAWQSRHGSQGMAVKAWQDRQARQTGKADRQGRQARQAGLQTGSRG